MANLTFDQTHVVSSSSVVSRNWYAWLNTMPPKPDDFHVTGEVQVGNPGVHALLLKKEPQGINPAILLLDLHLVQKPGIWPQIVSWAPARYDEIVRGTTYTEVSILFDGKVIATMPVEIVS